MGFTVPSVADSPDSTLLERPLRSTQTGQNSIAPENSLPQLGQVRCGSALIFPPALLRQSQRTAIPISADWCENSQQGFWQHCRSLARVIAYSVTIPREIASRNKIPAARVSRHPALLNELRNYCNPKDKTAGRLGI